MARGTLTGTRIRERRIARGMRQAELARQAGISASYLNLIEHNRRRIGGKLLNGIAGILEVEPAVLSEGAGAALIAGLREAAGSLPRAGAELDRVDEFAGRFPGWAQLATDSRARIAQLERTVEALTDRMTHDPHLSTTLHEMLSTVTSIRSTAAILAEPGEIAPEWRARFHRNVDEDAARLAETARGLVTYLGEAEDDATGETGSPQEELDAAWDAVGHHVPALEAGAPVDAVLQEMGAGLSKGARSMLRGRLETYAADARALPMPAFEDAALRLGPDTEALAEALDAEPARVMRRLAALPAGVLPDPVGFVACDASGVLTYRRPLPDFPMPRVGAGCPLWPLYRALARPLVIHAADVARPGGDATVLRAEALAVARGRPAVNRDPIFEAQMILRRSPDDRPPEPLRIGSACRVCPLPACEARREPSLLAAAAAS